MAQGSGQSPVNVAQHLKGMDFPADKQDLVEHARQDGAEQEVVQVLEQMPSGQYQDMSDVMKGVGQVE